MYEYVNINFQSIIALGWNKADLTANSVNFFLLSLAPYLYPTKNGNLGFDEVSRDIKIQDISLFFVQPFN